MTPGGVRVGVAGACGRMGRALSAAVQSTDGFVLAAVWEAPEHAEVGRAYGDLPGLEVGTGPEGALDIVLDFTAPEATVRLAAWCAERGTRMVIGTTGLEGEHRTAIEAAAERVPVVLAPNMSIGINVLLELVSLAARMVGPAFDLELCETHHRMKKDAPSGTALRLLEALRQARTDCDPVFARHGIIGARRPEEIGVQTLRGGDVVGEHTVFLFGEGERLELTHRATDRGIFVSGAVRAATWLLDREPGLYSMADVLAA